MTKYLYGAAVQGIQSFIFQTNKLQEIVGASELVEEICGDFFKDQVGDTFKEENLLVGAAGNIKYVFDSKDECASIARNFPKAVMEKASGITISQAVVEVGKYEDDIQELENRLRVQRNKAITIRDNAGLMATETARRTGGVGFKYENDEVLDQGQVQKLKASKIANKRLTKDIFNTKEFAAEAFPFDIGEMVKKETNQSWIAVIHADGNSLGKKLIEMGGILKEEAGQGAFRSFSKKLDESTKAAARIAFDEVVANAVEKEGLHKIPFRPVLLGGDDLTAIIRGDLALDFTHVFLDAFEKETKREFASFDTDYGLNKTLFSEELTACAGIAYIKASYPFHYGVTLAESLCQEAKKVSRKFDEEHSPSSIMFHKVHASFVEDYEDIIEKELRAKGNVFFNYGPYFLQKHENYDTVKSLKERIKTINRKAAPKSGLRNWLTELQHNADKAAQTLERIASLEGNRDYRQSLNLEQAFVIRTTTIDGKEIEGKYTPIFDAITLSKI